MKAIVKNANIRGCEAKTNKKGEGYLLVRYEDETGKPEVLIDKDMSRQPFYKRDVDMDLFINIDIGKQFTTVRIVDAREITRG